MRGSARPARRGCALLLVLVVLAGASAASAAEDESTAYNAVTGIGATLCTLGYAPLKLVYAVGGTLISGLAWVWTLGNQEVAGPIFRSAVRGDYVVTPAHLEGRRALHFVGSQY